MKKNNKGHKPNKKAKRAKSTRVRVKRKNNEITQSDFNNFSLLSSLFAQSSSSDFQSVSKEFDLDILLSGYCKTNLAKIFAGLSFEKELHCNAVVLESIIHALFLLTSGSKSADREIINALFDRLQCSHVGSMCDPAEDVMVGVINTVEGTYRILEGLWESGSFHCQRFIEIIEKMPEREPFKSLKNSTYALLKVSNLTVVKTGLPFFERGNDHPILGMSEITLRSLEQISERAVVKKSDLDSLGIDSSNLDQFILRHSDYSKIEHGTFGNSVLERQPIVKISEDEFLLALPTAVSIAVRTHIIEWCDKHDYLDILQKSFNASWVNHFTNEVDILGDLKNPPFAPLRDEAKSIIGAECAVGIDDRRMFHIMLIFDDFSHYTDGYVDSKSLMNKGGYISNSVKKMQSFAKTQPHLERGLSLIVGCGWGRTMFFDLGENLHLTNWDIETVSASDLDSFSRVSGMNACSFWSLIEAKRKVTEAGVITQNVNGLLNLYSWAKNNNGNIVPHDNLPPELAEINNFFMMIGQNELLDVRWETKYEEFIHIAAEPYGDLIKVRRLNTGSYFSEDRFRPIFASIDHAKKGELLAFVDGEFACWWCKPVTFSVGSRDLTYRIWTSICGWLLKIDKALNHRGLTFPYQCIRIEYDFSDLDIPSQFENIPTFDDLKKLTDVVTIIKDDIFHIKISLKKGYLSGFYRHENFAESNIVWSIISAITSNIFSHQVSILNDVFRMVVPNNVGKNIHLFRADSFIDFVRQSLPEALFQSQIDHAASKIGLGWFGKYAGKSIHIAEKVDCTEYIKGLNWSLWLKIKKALAAFNKKELVKYLLLHHEAAESDSIHWQRTYPAILGIHENLEQVKTVVLDRISSNNSTLSGIRILVEMAICEASLTETLMPNKIDIQNLIIYATALFQFGNLSDAIHFEMVDPTIKITGLGDVHYDHSFYDKVVMPYGGRVQNKLIENSARKFSKLFSENNSRENPSVEDIFETSWRVEYGVSIGDVLDILEHFENIGHKKQTAVYEIERDDLVDSISNTTINKEKFLKFISEFSLSERKCWDVVPEGFKEGDISPWRFKRRLSVVAKPLIYIGDSYIVSPSLIRKGLAYLITNSYDGTLDGGFFRSKQMKSWIGGIRDKSGHAFNIQAKSEFERLGMNALSDVKVSQILGKKTEKNYGDVDVLAWKPELNTVFLVECKDLEFAKTQGEIAKQVHEFRGLCKVDGSPDRLKRHLERCSILRNNMDKLGKFLKLGKIEKLHVVLLFKQVVPVHYEPVSGDFDVKTVFFDELESEVSEMLQIDR